MSPLPTACWSFTARADLRWNAACIARGITAAQAAGAKVLLTPECSLVGYPSAVRPHLIGVDWCLVGELEDQLLLAAERAEVLLVLGSAEPQSVDAGRIANVAVAGGAVAPVRYRKRHLTPTDEQHFVPGSPAVAVSAFGWRFGLGICFDLRFDGLWRELAAADADAFLVIAHMAGPDVDPGTKSAVIPAFCAVRSAAWATPLAFANTAAPDRWLGSGLWDARGMRMADAADPVDDGHLLVGTLTPRTGLHPWYEGLRNAHLGRPG